MKRFAFLTRHTDYSSWFLGNTPKVYSGFPRFYFKVGKKYYKILRNESAHCFIDIETLDVYKPSSHSSPAKGIRYNLNKDMEFLKENADIYGGYLYR